MWRFVLKENIRRFQVLLGQANTDEERQTLQQLLNEAELELDELEEASTSEIAKQDASLNFIAGRAVERAMGLQGSQFASLQIFDESREHLIILAQRNLRAKFLHHLAHIKPGDGSACGRCLAHNEHAAIGDTNEDEGFAPHREAASEAGFQAVSAFPLRDGSGRLIAVLSTYFEAPQQFSDASLSSVTDLANAIGRQIEGHINDNVPFFAPSTTSSD